jgi:hypothetical protein
MNHDLLCGLADVIGDDVLAAHLEPSESYCCVRLNTKQHTPKDR